MKANFYTHQEQSPFRKDVCKCFIIFFLFFLLFSISGFGQPMGEYPPTTINAELVDTANVSRCGLPFLISNKAPLTGQKVKWKVVKGTAQLLYDSLANMQVKDMMPDTSILTYTIFDAGGNTVSIDSLVLLLGSSACQVIDRPFISPIVTCGSSLTLYSKLRPGYTYWWYTSSPNAQIVNPSTDDVTVNFLAAGSYVITVQATSPSGNFILMDNITVNVTCATTVTQANAGADVFIDPCNFPYTLNGNAPASDETVSWQVISGNANLENANSRNLRVMDAGGGSTTLRYTITKNGQSTYDDMILNVHQMTPDCNPIISKANLVCNETFTSTFNFGFGVTPGYEFVYTLPPGVMFDNMPNTNPQSLRVLNPGTHIIQVTVRSPYRTNTFTKSFTISANCGINAGADLYLAPCNFPHHLIGSEPELNQTVSWSVVSGEAVLENADSRFAKIIDAVAGTVLRYTITGSNGTFTDDLIIYIYNTFPHCNPNISKNNLTCGEVFTSNFSWSGNELSTYEYILPSGVVFNGAPNVNPQSLKVVAPGSHVVQVKVTSPQAFHTFTKSFTVNATCNNPVTPANAGPDANAYCHRFQLSGNAPGVGETGTWKLVEGIATIEGINNPTTYIGNLASSKLVFVWTISNTFTSSTDTVKINVNKLDVLVSNAVNATCGNNNGSVLAQATGGLPPYTVQWQGSLPGNTLNNVPAGTYYVTVTDQSGCQVLDSVIILNDCVGPDLYTVEGNVFAGTGLQQYGLVILMQDIGGLPIPVKTVHLMNGYYKFTDVEAADYLVYVLPYKDKALTQLDNKYLPTFYVNKVSIFFANPIHVIGNTYSVDIHLVEKKAAHYGASKLLANVNMGTHTTTPLLPVLLFNDRNELVAASYYNGESVSFEGLAPGDYYISMPINEEGYEDSQPIEVGSGDKVSNVVMSQGVLSANKDASMLNTVKSFPNPFKELLSVDLGNLSGSFTIRIIDGVLGKTVKEFNISSSGNQHQIDTDDLPAGLYILQISNGIEIKNLPLVKL